MRDGKVDNKIINKKCVFNGINKGKRDGGRGERRQTKTEQKQNLAIHNCFVNISMSTFNAFNYLNVEHCIALMNARARNLTAMKNCKNENRENRQMQRPCHILNVCVHV